MAALAAPGPGPLTSGGAAAAAPLRPGLPGLPSRSGAGALRRLARDRPRAAAARRLRGAEAALRRGREALAPPGAQRALRDGPGHLGHTGNHKVTEAGNDLRDRAVQPTSERHRAKQSVAPSAMSRLPLNTSRDGDSTLGRLDQCLIT